MVVYDYGSIIHMSSVSVQRGGGIFGGVHYSVAKSGMLGMSKTMARELEPFGIRINSIAPGLINTDITKGKLELKLKQKTIENISPERLGEAKNVASACLFLASDLSEYITGSVIDVNGGMHMH